MKASQSKATAKQMSCGHTMQKMGRQAVLKMPLHLMALPQLEELQVARVESAQQQVGQALRAQQVQQVHLRQPRLRPHPCLRLLRYSSTWMARAHRAIHLRWCRKT
jgi:hypothetical protein